MNDEKKEQSDRMAQCPACNRQGKPGVITWFKCAYCNGTGVVTQERCYAWNEDIQVQPLDGTRGGPHLPDRYTELAPTRFKEIWRD